jgi:glutamyl-tRNA synthetase
MAKEIRVRFAPSPTGALHIGGVRTALYNYLFAKKNGGKNILRIEDTDQSRFVPGAEEYIKKSLDWLQIKFDESPDIGGPHVPYRQSERRDIYGKYAQYLLDNDHAYYAFDTPEELDAMRERLKEARVANPQYNAITRMGMKNSLTLPPLEVQAMIEAGEPYVIRLKVPKKEEVRLNDLIRGWVMALSSTLDDKILVKSDGMPTYHLANVVDDRLMGITHVIRGEEWLPSAPLHVLLYRFLGWEKEMPQFAHLPLLLKPDGNGKLSKRDSMKNRFPIFPLEWPDPETGQMLMGFKEEGYLPEATINFLALLGWNPGTERELFTMDQLVEEFSIERINKAGARFDINKAIWFNQEYIKQKADNELAMELLRILEDNGVSVSNEKAVKICAVMKGRISFVKEIWNESRFFFEKPEQYDEKIAEKRWTREAVSTLILFKEELKSHKKITAEDARTMLHSAIEKSGAKTGPVMQALRLTLTGSGAGPDLMDIIEILGGPDTTERIENALTNLKDKISD